MIVQQYHLQLWTIWLFNNTIYSYEPYDCSTIPFTAMNHMIVQQYHLQLWTIWLFNNNIYSYEPYDCSTNIYSYEPYDC